MRRHQVFLGDQLDDVGQRLQQSVRAHAVRPRAHLNVRDHLALHPLQVGQRGHEDKRRRAPILMRLMTKKSFIVSHVPDRSELVDRCVQVPALPPRNSAF